MPTYYDYEALDDIELTSETMVYLVRNINNESGHEFFNLRGASPLMFSTLTRDPETRVENYWGIDHALLPNETISRHFDVIFPQNKLTQAVLTRAEIEDIFPGCLSKIPVLFPRALIERVQQLELNLAQNQAESAQLSLQLQILSQELARREGGALADLFNRVRSGLSAGAAAFRGMFQGFGAARPGPVNEQHTRAQTHQTQNIATMLEQGRKEEAPNTESPNQPQTHDSASRHRTVTRQLFHHHEQRTMLSGLVIEQGITERTMVERISAHSDAEPRLETILNHLDSFSDLIRNEHASLERLLDLDLEQLERLLSNRQSPEGQAILAAITQDPPSMNSPRP